ncbi:SpoIIE family protein phosphatase [Streptomyces sp. PKU-EA00015]|uniref:SpoIIE family protein phosphatase n=1 Tax=Streptomyces sp. PKU-EA00015 TaxID=2748326 RepID=UPI0015A4CA23|nr:SpoIIE family protein phosphatase [Streptomyces sp. PKU-EA00015]NWF25489.1 SpoIIE family protein phosphatase [Streptomyces sp. PKU-EA00015]
MGRADPSELVRHVLRVLRCREPQAMVDALTAAGEGLWSLPAGHTRLYVGRGTFLDVFPDPPGDEAVEEAAREVVHTGRPRTVHGTAGRTSVLPLATDGQVLGALAVGTEDGAGPDGDRPDPGLWSLLAEGCALALRARAEAGLLASAMDAAEAGVFAWDFAADDVYWDDRACAIYGVDPAEFDGRGETFFALLHPEDVPVLQAAIAQVTEAAVAAAESGDLAGSDRYHLAYRVVHRDGSVHHLAECGRVLVDHTGRPSRALGFVYETGAGSAASSAAQVSPDTSRDAFLFTLTRALSKAVTVRDVTQVMTDLARPALGAENLVLGIAEDGRLDIVGETRVAPALERLRGPAHAMMAFAATQDEPLFIEDLTQHSLPHIPGLGVAGPLPPRSWVVLSLGSADHVTGACLIAFAGPRHFDAGERTFYTAVAVILSQSLERAQLFDDEHQRATDLQEAMLPRHLPTLSALSVQSRYLPGTRGMHIGGDWYDVLPLSDGSAALVIGDVQGHDAHASAVMGQLRVALRTCAEAGLAPGTILSRVNRVLCDLETDRFATCAYLVLDPVDGTLNGARAGHPHPMRVRPGDVDEIRLAGGPPLGVDPRAHYPTTAATLGADEALVLFTDGLVERRDADIDTCVRRMADDIRGWLRTTARGGDMDLAALAEFLTGQDDPGRIDDVALLAVRRTA